jgi:hypothetical protein
VPVRHCLVVGCSRSAATTAGGRRGYCVGHYTRYKNGRPLDSAIRPYRANGPGHVTKGGYREIIVPGHPNGGRDSRILEHRFVMSQALGRPLVKGESIHHKNGDRLDNRIENLELWTGKQPSGHRVADAIDHAVEVLRLYAPARLAT